MSEHTASSSAGGSPPDRNSETDERDAIGALHKMSTTAGLGSQDYVAINPFSIAALLLGLASAAALLGNILLIVPVAAIVCGLVAWRQVRHSGGTQAGIGLAGLGMALAIILAGASITLQARVYLQHATDRQEIVSLIGQLSDVVVASEKNPEIWKDAYQLFDQPFQLSVKESDFVSRWKSLQNTLGAIHGLSWNGANPQFEKDPVTGELTGTALVIISFKDATREAGRYNMGFRQIGSKTWRIDNFPILFPENAPEPPEDDGHGHSH